MNNNLQGKCLLNCVNKAKNKKSKIQLHFRTFATNSQANYKNFKKSQIDKLIILKRVLSEK
jgi:hypothetical protein